MASALPAGSYGGGSPTLAMIYAVLELRRRDLQKAVHLTVAMAPDFPGILCAWLVKDVRPPRPVPEVQP